MRTIAIIMDSEGIKAQLCYSNVSTKVTWEEIDKFRKGVILSSDGSGDVSETEKGGNNGGNE